MSHCCLVWSSPPASWMDVEFCNQREIIKTLLRTGLGVWMQSYPQHSTGQYNHKECPDQRIGSRIHLWMRISRKYSKGMFIEWIGGVMQHLFKSSIVPTLWQKAFPFWFLSKERLFRCWSRNKKMCDKKLKYIRRDSVNVTGREEQSSVLRKIKRWLPSPLCSYIGYNRGNEEWNWEKENGQHSM